MSAKLCVFVEAPMKILNLTLKGYLPTGTFVEQLAHRTANGIGSRPDTDLIQAFVLKHETQTIKTTRNSLRSSMSFSWMASPPEESSTLRPVCCHSTTRVRTSFVRRQGRLHLHGVRQNVACV